MDDPKGSKIKWRRPFLPQHVLRTISAWATANKLVSAVYGAGSRFDRLARDVHPLDDTEDLDLLILPTFGTDTLSKQTVAEWRSKLSILTAFQVHLHIVEAGAGFPIFERAHHRHT